MERLGVATTTAQLRAEQWSIVDHHEDAGRRYLVVVEAPAAESLTTREREVLAAAAGHTSKAIAFDLGLSDSTVRVLMSRVRNDSA
jgi:DNA-binding NarL/FixJ family response regulator